jgi:phage-related protein
MDFVGEFVNGALEIYNKFIAPVVKWFIEKFGPPISKVISGLITFIGDFLGGIVDAVSGIITALKGIVQFITGVFTGDWKKAWEGVKNIFKGVFDALVGIAKTPINLIIDLINGMISGIVSGINTVLKAVNSISFELPKALGGFKVGFNIPLVTAPKIPKLATGTVVPKNYGEFLSILGDNTREAEVVSPLSTMKQAFKEAMTELGGGATGNINLNVYLSGKQIHSEVVRVDKEVQTQTGKSAFVPA